MERRQVKVKLRGREVDISPLPLDESGDALAGLLAKVATVESDAAARTLFREIGVAALAMWAGLDTRA